ncbi:hypothetical protein LDENG_00185430 [Lucifuga dentata]|nr:hypothetical protein LDENG_00185430 [Lucifuga dentata]
MMTRAKGILLGLALVQVSSALTLCNDAKPQPLSAKVEGTLTLLTGVNLTVGDYVVWFNGSESDVLLIYMDGEVNSTQNTTGSLQFDRQTGDLHISAVRSNQSGIYTVQIINGNSTCYKFNVTVSAADPGGPTSGPPYEWVIPVTVSGVVIILIILAVWWMKKKKNNIGNGWSPATQSTADAADTAV